MVSGFVIYQITIKIKGNDEMVFQIYDFLSDDAKRIRESVFMEEQGFKNEFDDIDDFAIHIVLYEDKIPVATCRIFKEDDSQTYTLGRLAVMKPYRGKNIGTRMLKEAEKIVIQKNGNAIKLHAQCRVTDFYARVGYSSYGIIENDEGCPHIWMKKTLR